MLVIDKSLIASLAVLALIGFCGPPVKAAVIINALEQGNNVVFTYAGRLDTTGFNAFGSVNYNSVIIPGSGEFLSSPDATVSAMMLRGSPVSYNLVPYGRSDSNWSYPSSTLGDYFSLAYTGSGPMIYLPWSFVSNSGGQGSDLSGSMTFTAATFSTLGLSPGTYTTILPNDTITMNIGAVPAPLPLLGLGAATAFSRKLKQRIALRRKREELGEAA
jgi:hypothetical protein